MKRWGLVGCIGLLIFGGSIGSLAYFWTHRHADGSAIDANQAGSASPADTTLPDHLAGTDSDVAPATSDEVDAVESGVASFHSELNQQDYGDIWSSYDSDAHTGLSQTRVIATLTRLHDRAGNAGTATRQSVTRVTNGGVSSIRATYRTRYDRATVDESFLYRWQGGTLQLHDYRSGT